MKSFFVNVVYSHTQRVYCPVAGTAADAICMAIDMMEAEGIDLKACGTMAFVAKPDDGANGYMAQFDQPHYLEADYEVIECAPV